MNFSKKFLSWGFAGFLALSLSACGGGGDELDSDPDLGGSAGSSTGGSTTGGGTTSGGSSTGSGTSGGTTTGGTSGGSTGDPISLTVTMDTAPCENIQALLALDDNTILLGCAGSVDYGLFRSTDGGANFSQIKSLTIPASSTTISLNQFRVNDLEKDSDGNIYICGNTGSGTSNIGLVKANSSLTTGEVILSYSDKGSGGLTEDLENVIVHGDTIIVDSLTGSLMGYSKDGGDTWSFFGSEDADKTTTTQVSDIIVDNDYIYASGGVEKTGPYFFKVSFADLDSSISKIDGSEADLYKSLFKATDLQSPFENYQEGRGVTQTDGGRLLMSGLLNSDAGVWVFYSDDKGETWTEATIAGNNGETMEQLEEVACSGDVCFAAGQGKSGKYLILVSQDEGLNWEAITLTKATTLQMYSIGVSDNRVWIGGASASSFVIIDLE